MNPAPPAAYRCEPISVNGRSLRADPIAVATARAFVPLTLGELAVNDSDHADDVSVVVSELVTNAITHVVGIRNVRLDIEVWRLWTRVIVDDRDPTVHAPSADVAADPLPESLRGLLIVKTLSERFWWQRRLISKAAHAVILRSGVTLTDVDRTILDRLEIDG